MADRSVLALIRMRLEAVVEPGQNGTDGKRTRNEKGLPVALKILGRVESSAGV
jgi:hypothetical protein